MKKKLIYIAVSVLTCLAICLSVAMCKKKDNGKTMPLPYEKAEQNNPESFTAAENERYALKWDKENKRVIFLDKEKNIPWCYVPYEAQAVEYDADGYEVIRHPQILSPINIRIFDKTKSIFDTTIGQNGCIKKNTFSVSEIENGLNITFYFDKEKIAVPVDYILREDSLLMKIDPTKIREGDKWQLVSVSLAPFLCSVKNATEDTYLFVPSGSGALVYADEEKDDAIDHSEEMYGIGSRVPDESAIKTVTADLTMPVYGAKNGDRSMLAIIENASESTSIRVNTWNRNVGYSAVYADFEVRSHTTLYKNQDWGAVHKYSQEMTTNTLAVGFYPLYAEESDYVGMAKKYRAYLVENGMKESREEERMIHLEILGGTNTTEMAMGVPYQTVYPTTTVKEAREMVSEILELTGQKPIVQLCGFGESGLDIGKIAGNLKVNGKMGSAKDLQNFAAYCAEQKIGLYFDYDVLQYKEDSSLASVKKDSALAVNNRNIRLNYYYSWSGTVDSTGKGWNNSSNFTLIKRSRIPAILDRIIKTSSKNNLNGISLTTLGKIAYSDNSEQQYYSKGQMPLQVAEEIERVREAGFKVLLSAANAYAAQAADYVLDAPAKSSRYDFMDEDVPFYQIVFKGTIPLASAPVTMSGDVDRTVLQAVETGTGLTFALSYDYSNKVIGSQDVRYYGSSYPAAKEIIQNAVKEYKDYYAAVKGAKIVRHSALTQEVKTTEYDNGVVVFVNYSDTPFETPFGVVEPNSFQYYDGGEGA